MEKRDASRLSGLSPDEKRRILADLLITQGREHGFALSRGQEALWFLHQLDQSNSSYNVAVAVRIRSSLDVERLGRAIEYLAKRHAMLRATIHAVDGAPVHRLRDVKSRLREHDATRVELDWLRKQVTAEAHRPFDLVNGPLFRAHLFRRAADDHVVLLVGHHIVVDFWSLQQIVQELATVYAAMAAGRAPQLRPVAATYRDFVQAEAECVEGPEGERLLAYWRTALAGDVQALDLPLDRPRPPVQSFRGASRAFALPAALSARLRRFAGEVGCTLNSVLLAAFKVLLMRLSGQDQVCVGIPTAARQRAQWEDVVGYFVNPVAVRSTAPADLPFDEFARSVHQSILRAIAHQEYPFPLLVEKLRPDRDPSRSPIFQAMFVLQQPHVMSEVTSLMLGREDVVVKLGAFQAQSFPIDPPGAQFDIELMMGEWEGVLAGRLLYNSDLFHDATVARFIDVFETLLADVVERPAARVGDLRVVSSTQQRALARWNETATTLPSRGFLEQFAAVAKATPDAPAVEYQGAVTTYDRLERLSNQVAAELRSRGASAESRVAILMERSPDMLAAILGVLKAGAAYVPLDPAYPASRLEYILGDSRADLTITTSAFSPLLAPEQRQQALHADESWSAVRHHSGEPVEVATDSHQLAYVIYTSGSTGRPKGVMIEHVGMLNHLWAKVAALGLTREDRVLQTASQCFDISVWQFLAPLMVGARVCIVADAEVGDPAALVARIHDSSATVAEFVPSVLDCLMEEVANGLSSHLRTLRWMLVTGETVSAETCRRWRAQFRSVPLMNAYGPTECSDDVTHYVVGDVPAGTPVPLGSALPNTQLHVLDRRLNQVPIGVYGELFVGGLGVGRGYLGQPERTAESFISDPFTDRPGARLYRTGDKVRFLPDGNLEFAGRFDDQVKVRGFRIELGEIEALLRAHVDVRDCVVSVRSDESPGASTASHLVAYVVKHPDRLSRQTHLRDWLAERLAPYMVPEIFVELERLPRTENGKVDRKALPNPPAADGTMATATTPTQKQLAKIWGEVLGLETAPIHANFFALGGHSLQATRVMSRVRSAFQVSLPVRALFEAPTIATLSERIELALSTRETGAERPLVAIPRDRRLPLSFAQQRLWFLDRWDPGSVTYSIPIALRFHGHLRVEALERSLNQIIARHEVLRTRFAEADGEPWQVIDPPAALTVPLVDLTGLPEEQRDERAAALATEESRRPFDLEHGPLARAALIRLGPETHVFLLNLHHIVIDGWSLGVLVRELAQLYDTNTRGLADGLPPLTVQYADFAHWQRESLKGVALERPLAFWKERLKAVPVLDLPTDRPRPAVRSSRGAAFSVELESSLKQQLDKFCAREQVTPFMCLLAAFQAVLHRYSGQVDIAVGTPVAGRSRPEIEELIGFFVNTLVIRTDLADDPSFRSLVARVRDSSLGALAHQDLPFERIVEELGAARDLSHSPVFQVVFALNNAPMPPLHLPGLEIEPVEVTRNTAKFELTLLVDEIGDGLRATWEYSTDLWDESSIRRMAGHYQNLLCAALRDPDERIARLPLMTPEEQSSLRDVWPPLPVRSEARCLHQWFEDQAQQSADRVAVVLDGQPTTYRELNVRANRLAHYLRGRGVGPGTRVGILLERSPTLLVAILATLKAGGAYVPLDPAHPVERIRFIAEDARLHLLLSSGIFELDLAEGRLLDLDRHEEEINQQPLDSPLQRNSPEDVAYIIYTSGSTGRPKGVAVTHHNVARLFAATEPWFGFGAEDVWTLFHSCAFDFSVWEMWGAMLYGGRLVIVPHRTSRSPDEFRELIVRERVTVLNQTPSALRQLIDVDQEMPAAGLSLKWIILGGEALNVSALRPWIDRYGDENPQLINMFGITETTVHVTYRRIRTADLESAASVIGRPIPDLRLSLRDPEMRVVPFGIPGEIYVGGAGLASGYFERPELTAERFVEDPAHPGERLYRSGDRGRLRADGELEYLGRGDHQVKIRGFRVEPGEVEHALSSHPDLDKVVVIDRTNAAGDRQLVAYYESPAGVTPDDLRRFARLKLPEHMVPAFLVPIATLPLTVNGKLDRAALPIPEEAAVTRVFVAPQDGLERAIADIWADLLGAPTVGVNDNFFEIGGHSLLLVRVKSRIAQATGRDVRIVDLFQYPTVSALSAFLSGSGSESTSAAQAAERASSRRDSLRAQNERRRRRG